MMSNDRQSSLKGRAAGEFVDRRGRPRPVPVIGILGGIASGTTLAADASAERGAEVINVDRIGHALLKEKWVIEALQARFGREIIGAEGQVNRRRLGRLVFADQAKLEELNRLMHPPMRARIADRIEHAVSAGARAVVIDAALLMEHDLGASYCTHLIFIDVPEVERCRRAADQRGWPPEELARREGFQMPLEEKKQAADAVFPNVSDERTLKDNVIEWFEELAPARRSSGAVQGGSKQG